MATTAKKNASELKAYAGTPESGAGDKPMTRKEVLDHERVRRHVISVLVKNVPGLLAHCANLFAARGYNIQSLTVAETEDERYSRMTIVVTGEDIIIDALKKGLSKFVNVIHVLDFTGVEHIERDLALVKLNIPAGSRPEILQLVEAFEGQVVDMGLQECMIRLTGPERKIQSFLELVKPYGILEMARTGRVALACGPKMEGHAIPE
jgi:acetolactate synthase-1/3 small subunit